MPPLRKTQGAISKHVTWANRVQRDDNLGQSTESSDGEEGNEDSDGAPQFPAADAATLQILQALREERNALSAKSEGTLPLAAGLQEVQKNAENEKNSRPGKA